MIEHGKLSQRKLCKQFSRSTSLDNCPAEGITVTGASRDNLHKISENGLVFESNGIHDHKKIDNKNAVICTRYKNQGSPKWERNVERQYGAYLKTPNIKTISESLQNDPNNQPEGPYASSKSQDAKNQNTQSITQSLKSMVKLYTNPVYVLINVCMSTYILIFIPILTVIVDYGIDKGIPEIYGKYLINSMAIGDLIGRLGFGWVTDKKLMTVSSFMCLTFILQGISIMLFPFAISLAFFMALLILYGIMAGAILVLFPVLVLTYLDINTQTVGMACMPFMSGIMSFAIPPMIGHFRDDVGSYDGMFYLTGIISIVSGGGWLLEPVVAKWYYGKKDMKTEKEADVHNANLNQNNHMDATDCQNKSVVR
ncbi:hypothetical protein JTE90_022266 [Oedothorax gibbosus]|uniref:Monocarboxylate transporter n=1 Tax=Oedothorax gibbosus TaxID=931172 RepID=A0AAV6VVF8_9ARAC|nr:hypothetical protein JTE90_022266 [Oedothorax gibbosus]